MKVSKENLVTREKNKRMNLNSAHFRRYESHDQESMKKYFTQKWCVSLLTSTRVTQIQRTVKEICVADLVLTGVSHRWNDPTIYYPNRTLLRVKGHN